ncbi:conserved membrane hypothetical protein [Paraburkholderia tropica]|uniref:hypothetical protein n=1 Tax=Paraburkholderia tropica TaxID=92647 RepID=UPI001CB1B76C|nr:hypothetical protein [Paraburkholderia tropica]CAG9217786.1 conserved membrane hypothetical protein [Paraburkholderia tropica]
MAEDVHQTEKVQCEDDGGYLGKWKDLDQHIIIRRTDEYCVCLKKDLRIDWQTSVEFDKAENAGDPEVKRKRSALLAEITVEELKAADGFSDSVLIRQRTLLGEATVLCLEADFDGAQKTIESARTVLQARSDEMSRQWYLRASATATFPFVLFFAVFWLNRDYCLKAVGPTAYWLLLAACGGALGALFSVIARSGDMHFELGASKDLHYLEGVSRIIAGAISGLLVAMAVRSDLIFGAFARGEHMSIVSMLAAVAGGTGERLAKSIISRFDEKPHDDKSEGS